VNFQSLAGSTVRLSERAVDGGFRTRDIASGSVYGSQLAVVIDSAGDAHVFYAEAPSLGASWRLREFIGREDGGDGLLTVDSTVDVRGFPSAVIDADGSLVWSATTTTRTRRSACVALLVATDSRKTG